MTRSLGVSSGSLWHARRSKRLGGHDQRIERTGCPIELRHVHKLFDDLVAVDDVSLSISGGEHIAIVGPSGGGKSTVLAMIAGLQEPTDGEVDIDGSLAPRQRLAHCALMPQADLLLPWRTAIDNACLALENRGVRRDEARRQAQPLFEHFGLTAFEHTPPAQLSGGMRQRVSFIRTLMAEKRVLLLDEPFGALDSLTRADMQAWLMQALADEPQTVLLVTHDVEEALLLSNRVIVLSSRPARVVADFAIDITRQGTRREIVTTTDFVELRESILEALHC